MRRLKFFFLWVAIRFSCIHLDESSVSFWVQIAFQIVDYVLHKTKGKIIEKYKILFPKNKHSKKKIQK